MDKPDTYPVEAVVNYFLDFAKRNKTIITPMKLQKMLYFANGWSWAFYGKPIIQDECHAWEYGPVYPSVYHEYKSPIKAKPIDPDHKMVVFPNDEPFIPQEDTNAIELLESIGRNYGSLNAITLSDMTHVNSPKNPWLLARQKNREDNIMKHNEIREYFLELKRERKLF